MLCWIMADKLLWYGSGVRMFFFAFALNFHLAVVGTVRSVHWSTNDIMCPIPMDLTPRSASSAALRLPRFWLPFVDELH